MWFNSKQRAEPYQLLTWRSRLLEIEVVSSAGSRTGAAWLSSARVVRCWVKSRTSATLIVDCHQVWLGTLTRLPVINRRKVGMTSSPHGPYGLGYTRTTMVITKGSDGATPSKSLKIISVRIVLCNSRT